MLDPDRTLELCAMQRPTVGHRVIPGGQVLDLDRLTALTMGKNPWVVDIREETQVVLFSHGTGV